MRLWSLHPKYLDKMGLLAVWREGLLAQSVLLKGETLICDKCGGNGFYDELSSIGKHDNAFPGILETKKCEKCKGTGKIKTPYWNHPQLDRWKEQFKYSFFPGEVYRSMTEYLLFIAKEAENRGYNFNTDKLWKPPRPVQYLSIPVTSDQLKYEWKHLQDKIYKREGLSLFDDIMPDGSKWHSNEESIEEEVGNIGKGKNVFHFVLIEGNYDKIEPHPLFKVVEGEIEHWEKRK